ncbi:MAG: hypothetical protein EZS28_031327 [Streblomastix strix]|uniref:Uncharacterized protein n=1 Tax=Streblomastix strix TaxID=222440 RepID=A0A5J4UR36_9EUKA|nr:MAG: hypothetical protein EZS28_031327 [Streblomastix strix]
MLTYKDSHRENSANSDFAFSAESGIVWMYDSSWHNSGDVVPDQITPASDATPLADSGTGVAGTSNEYCRGDHKHPLNISVSLPAKDTSVGTIGSASTQARSDHQHPIQTADSLPNSDSVDGYYGTVDFYARNDHSHPINVQTNASIVPLVDGVGNNGTSAYYSRHNHIHPQQLTYDGNITATKFIKIGGTNQQIMLADGTNKLIIDFNSSVVSKDQNINADNSIYCDIINDSMQINPIATSYDDNLRKSRSSTDTGNSSIQLGYSRTSNTGLIEGQWSIVTTPNTAISNPQGLIIAMASQADDNTRELQISADGNTQTFNGRVL